MKPQIVCAFALSCWAMRGQDAPAKPEFEAVSIKPAQQEPMGRVRIGMNADAGMLRYTNVSLNNIICAAYRVKEYQVQGPDWLNSARFEIEAKLPAGASQDQIPEMLQGMLAERFRLAVQHDRKEHAVYALVVGKSGPKLKRADIAAKDAGPAGAMPGKGGFARGQMMVRMAASGVHLKTPSASLENFAEMLSRFSERPVVNMTNIQGQYDFDLEFVPETMRGMPAPMKPPQGEADHERPPSDEPKEEAVSMFEAVERCGLKLEPRKAPIQVLVVDHVERTPTKN